MCVSRAFIFFAALVLVPGAIEAQERWGFDFRVGGATATTELGDADLKTGFGFEGTVMLRAMEHLFAYAGWDWHRFQSDQSFAGTDINFEETGYAFGLLFEHPFSGDAGPAIQVRVGGTANHIEVEDGDDIIADSGHGIGWEAGAGVAVPIGDVWRLTPGVRFRMLSRDLEIGTVSRDVDLNYVAFDIGISRLF